MLPIRLTFFFGLLYALNGQCQMLFSTGETFALGNITSVGNSPWRVNGNAAQLANLQHASILLGQTLPYGISQLSSTQVSSAVPINKHSGIGAQLIRSGHQLITHTQLNLSYGLLLTPELTGGIKIHYHRWNQGEGYATFQTIAPEIGLIANIADKVHIGSQIQLNTANNNPFKNEVDLFKIGLQYEADKKLTFLSELTSTNNQQQLIIGGRYIINNWASVLLATGINPGLFSFGFTLAKNKSLQINAATQWQPLLGFTPSIGFLYVAP